MSRAALTLIAIAIIAGTRIAAGAEKPAPEPSPSPRGFEWHLNIKSVFLSQANSGPGLQPVEGPAFIQGAPAAPLTPYDPFSGAPIVPGNVQQNQFALDTAWHGSKATIGATFGIETLLGDRTNETYWVEPLQPQDNPHVGSTATGFSIVFPTHPGNDDFDGVRSGVLQVRLSSIGERLHIRAGWLDLAQSLGCVFNPPPTTNSLPGLLLKTPESLNQSAPGLTAWEAPPATLPLRGLDATFLSGTTTFEASDVALPSLPGTPARMTSISAGHFNDSGYGAIVQWLRVRTGGDPIVTSTGWGVPSQIVPTDQGEFTVSTLYGQRESIVGGKISEPLGIGLDATLEFSHSTYQADGLGKPGSVGGAWKHAALSHALGIGSVSAQYFRFEPTFATLVLPYGTPENIWSVAYSWPGPWLKSTFQLVDSSTLGVNREGPEFSYAVDTGRLKASASYSSFHQIAQFDSSDFQNLGFIDGFFLVERNPAEATLGSFHRTAAFVGKHFPIADIGLDFVDDDLHRDAAADQPFDAVSFDAPQYVLSFTRAFRSSAVAVAGYGYFGTRGSWTDGAMTNLDYGVHELFAGAQFQETARGAMMISLRRSAMRGMPYFGSLGALRYGSPNFNATAIFVEQRYHL